LIEINFDVLPSFCVNRHLRFQICHGESTGVDATGVEDLAESPDWIADALADRRPSITHQKLGEQPDGRPSIASPRRELR